MPSQVGGIAALVERMDVLLAQLRSARDPRLYFLSVYRRMTLAVDGCLQDGFFVDPTWVEAWDVAFADFYLSALQADEPPGPWVAAFGAPRSMPALRHVLLGMNAHINYDLPQSLLAVIDDDEARDGALMARRRIDHMRVNELITGRVRDEDDEMAAAGVRSGIDRFLAPLNRQASRRFLTEARRKVWTNTLDLAAARRHGSDSYAAWLEPVVGAQRAARPRSDRTRPGVASPRAQRVWRAAASGRADALVRPHRARRRRARRVVDLLPARLAGLSPGGLAADPRSFRDVAAAVREAPGGCCAPVGRGRRIPRPHEQLPPTAG